MKSHKNQAIGPLLNVFLMIQFVEILQKVAKASHAHGFPVSEALAGYREIVKELSRLDDLSPSLQLSGLKEYLRARGDEAQQAAKTSEALSGPPPEPDGKEGDIGIVLFPREASNELKMTPIGPGMPIPKPDYDQAELQAWFRDLDEWRRKHAEGSEDDRPPEFEVLTPGEDERRDQADSLASIMRQFCPAGGELDFGIQVDPLMPEGMMILRSGRNQVTVKNLKLEGEEPAPGEAKKMIREKTVYMDSARNQWDSKLEALESEAGVCEAAVVDYINDCAADDGGPRHEDVAVRTSDVSLPHLLTLVKRWDAAVTELKAYEEKIGAHESSEIPLPPLG